MKDIAILLRRHSRVDPSTRMLNGRHCRVWTRGTTCGYGMLWTGERQELTHRLAWKENFKTTPRCVLHHCDNRLCIEPKHLFEGTRADNATDRAAKGRNNSDLRRGRGNGRARLDESAVRNIRSSPLSLAKLAALYSVDRSTVHRVRTGARWSHVK